MQTMMRLLGRTVREVFWIAIAGAVIYAGVVGFRYLGENRQVVEAVPVDRPITLVETATLIPLDAALPIRGEGFVKPFRQVSLSSQSGGRITQLHPAITNQGDFRQGDVLVRIDDSSERASFDQTEANIAATQARLDLNATQLARTQSLVDSGVASQQALDQLLSQKAELEASLNSLRAVRTSAAVTLRNKVVIAPFDGTVLSKIAEIGTVVSGGQPIAEIFTSDRMEVDVPVREADAALIPGLFEGGQAPARVIVRFAGKEFEWDARVRRVASALDRRTRTLNVTVELTDVRNARVTGEQIVSGAPPALINSFAKVVIEGEKPDSTFAIPSTALRGGGKLWMFDPTEGDQGTMRMITATLLHVDGETSYVQIKDQPQGTRLIRTALQTPAEGMRLRDVAVMHKARLEAANTTQSALLVGE